MSRNIQTREGYELWDSLNAIPHYGFLLNPQGNGVVRAEGVGDWIERHAAQVVVDEAQSEVNELRKENAKLQAEVTALSKNVVEFTREDFDATLNNLRRMGASIDGDNAYKRDLCDTIAGAMAFGYQNTNHPPEGHWAKRFWDMGRAEGEMREALTAALRLTRENLRACQATIHYAGGFDPAYVNDAQTAMKFADEVLAKYPPLNPA
jgi:7-keto-8-aminopelargonate synthetase-like enzyme